MLKKSTNQNSSSRKVMDKKTGGYVPRRAPFWWGKEVSGIKEIIICPKCNALYFDKHWHTIPNFLKYCKKNFPEKKVREELCAECKWQAAGDQSWEGEVTLLNLNPEKKAEVLALVKNVDKRAMARDPEDRIIKIKDLGEKVVITTTENQLAASIGRQVDSAFKGGKLEIKWSDENAPARVRWTGKKES